MANDPLRTEANTIEALLTARQVAEALKISPRSVSDRRFRRRIGLQAVKVGGAVRFRASAVQGVMRPELEASARPVKRPPEKKGPR
jgi:hypothetical protein